MSFIKSPEILKVINPSWAVAFFVTNRLAGFLTLGVVFLVVTGGEALCADIGHFGRKPINQAWFYIVLPSLLLNYLGRRLILRSRRLRSLKLE